MESTDPTLRFISGTVDFVIIHTTLDGVIDAWLGAAERVLGFTSQEAIGRSLSMLFTEEDKARGLDVQEMAVALSQGRSEDDRWHVRKDGSTFWASGVLTAVRGANGEVTGLCKVLRDKTDVRTQLDSLENLVDRLKGELDAERKAVSSLAHELRNPLMPMLSALTLLQRSDAAHVRDKATRILVNQVDVLKRLLDDLNAVRLDPASAPDLTIERVNLNATLGELVGSLQDSPQSRMRHVSLVLPTSDIWVSADPARLQQMLLNLLSNALKYTVDGGHVDINATIEGDMAVIRVDDDGIGIAPHMLPRIFELFTRERRQPDVTGQGVGLAIVKQLAAAHGGFIEARSDGCDKGASFSLRIPIDRQTLATRARRLPC